MKNEPKNTHGPQANDLIHNSCGGHTRLKTPVLERTFQPRLVLLLLGIYVCFQLLSKMTILHFEKLHLSIGVENDRF